MGGHFLFEIVLAFAINDVIIYLPNIRKITVIIVKFQIFRLQIFRYLSIGQQILG